MRRGKKKGRGGPATRELREKEKKKVRTQGRGKKELAFAYLFEGLRHKKPFYKLHLRGGGKGLL